MVLCNLLSYCKTFAICCTNCDLTASHELQECSWYATKSQDYTMTLHNLKIECVISQLVHIFKIPKCTQSFKLWIVRNIVCLLCLLDTWLLLCEEVYRCNARQKMPVTVKQIPRNITVGAAESLPDSSPGLSQYPSVSTPQLVHRE